TGRLLPRVRASASGGRIYAFPSHVWVGFPLVNEAGGGWSSRFPTQWLLPGALMRLADKTGLDPQEERQLRGVEQYVIDSLAADFERRAPPPLIVATGNSSTPAPHLPTPA